MQPIPISDLAKRGVARSQIYGGRHSVCNELKFQKKVTEVKLVSTK
jgi:hypothetical protein